MGLYGQLAHFQLDRRGALSSVGSSLNALTWGLAGCFRWLESHHRRGERISGKTAGGGERSRIAGLWWCLTAGVARRAKTLADPPRITALRGKTVGGPRVLHGFLGGRIMGYLDGALVKRHSL